MIETTYEDISKLIDAGKIPDALGALEPLVEADPGNPRFLFLLGVCYFRTGQLEHAETSLRKAVASRSDHAMSYYYLGLVLERQGRVNEAVTEYKIARVVDPNLSFAQEKLRVLEGGDQKQSPVVPTLADAQGRQAPSPSRQAGSSEARTIPGQPDRTLAGTLQEARGDELSGAIGRIAGELLIERNRRLRSFSAAFVSAILLLVSAVFAILLASAEEYDPEPYAITGVILGLGGGLVLLCVYVQSVMTKYRVYERRIDFQSGVLFRKMVSVWLYQIEDTWITRSPFNLLTNDATVHFRASYLETPVEKPGHFKITGLGNYNEMLNLWQELRDAALVERRAMKNIWV